MTRLLVLRPEPGASETLQRASAIGLDAVAIPLFRIEPLAWTAPAPAEFDGLLLTSSNSARCAGPGLERLKSLPAYAVGGATAAAARGRGLNVILTGGAGVDALLADIEPGVRLLHLCGEDRITPADKSHSITHIPVYRASLNEGADLGAPGQCVALVHSPRAARRLAELAADRSQIAIAAISAAAASAAGAGWAQVGIADAPDDEALLALAARLCNISPLS
jgi:uroporphyrinogen-III synthase